MNRVFALVLLAVGFTTAARADYIPATWIDSADVGSGVYIGNSDSYTYTHDLTDIGFRPLNDIISSFHLSIDLADDDNNFWRDGLEFASIDLPGALGDAPLIWNFGGSGAEYGGWSILGLLQLNVLGTLTVTISSIYGDFNLVGSSLTASGLANTGSTSVPEPGALGLLGLGLMGMALSMRRRQLAKRS
jgi:hypothetical protein